MKRERWRTVLFLIILLIVTLFVRLFFIQPNMTSIMMEGDYYQKAVISNQELYKLQYFSVEELYTKALSFSLLIFGNFEMAGVYLNIILQVVAIIFIYFAIGFVANEYAAFLVAGVVALIPFYSDKVYEVSSFNFLILVYAVGLFVLAIICKGVYMFVMKKKTVEQEEKCSKDDFKEEQTGVITLDDIIGDSNSLKEVSKEQEDAKIEETTNKEEDVVPPGMKEIFIDEDEKKKKVKLLDNPLPVPKRRERKEMDFALELNDENDDYDIKDVSGMDFFDIE